MKTIFNFVIAALAMIAASFCSRSKTFVRRDPCAGGNVDADLYATTVTAVPPGKVSAAQYGGRVRLLRSTYTQGAADGAIGDIVRFGKLPLGATRLPLGRAFFSAGNANATMKFGITGADADMAAATAIAAAGSVDLDVFAASGAVSLLAAEKEVIGTNATAAIKAGQVITVWIPYVMND